MGIATNKFQTILTDIFKTGNVIKLLSDASSEANVTVLAGKTHTIESGDFVVSGNIAKSNQNMLFYLYEGAEAITATGFGVYNGSYLQYFGEFETPMVIEYNDVPTIKAYDADKGEGIYIKLTSVEVSSDGE